MQWTSAPNIGSAPLPQRARGYWKNKSARVSAALEDFLEAERGQLPLWAVAAFLFGISLWFALPAREQWVGLMAVAGAVAVNGFLVVPGRRGRALGWFGLMIAVGCAWIWGRSVMVDHRVFDRPQSGVVTGTVEKVEYLASRDSVRMTVRPNEPVLPEKVRVSFRDDDVPTALESGALVRFDARLTAPPQMLLPGTYDPARDLWFRGIGASGKAGGTPVIVEPSKGSGLERTREHLRRHIGGKLDERAGGIAIALVTGDQNSVTGDDADAMRRSGLTHLLSVSGLHIAAVVGFTIVALLRLLALSPWLALRFNLVLAAAAGGALAGIGYTMLTGMQVPTVRSCIAALLVLGGIALGRDAISMRLVAAGAMLVLIFRPEAAAGASFQMSFAAAMAIVALHSTAFSKRWFGQREEAWVWRVLRSFGGLIATGLAVEFALIPLALFHFHKAGLYGVAANIIGIPLTTFIIMPAEALALLFDTLGLGAPFWWVVEQSIHLLLWIAEQFATARGAVAALPSMPVWAFATVTVGVLWLCLWRGRVRRLGLVPVAVGSIAALATPTPDLLITGDGRHLAVIDDHGVPALLRSRTGSYIRDTLSEAAGFDGESGDLDLQTFGRCTDAACVATIDRDGHRWLLLATRNRNFLEWEPFIAACRSADIVVSDRRLPRACTPRWLKLDRPTLERTGGIVINLGSNPTVRTVAERVGDHPWQTKAARQ